MLFMYLFLVFICSSVTKNYFQNLVQALETGLADVNSSMTAKSKGQSLGKGRSGKLKITYGSSKGGSSSRVVDDDGHWYCEHCTYANMGPFSVCSMCHLQNPQN